MKINHLLNIAFAYVLLILLGCTDQPQMQKESKVSKLNTDLVSLLEIIDIDEQDPIRKGDAIRKLHGMESPEARIQDSIKHANHAKNIVKVGAIIKKHGWPGEDVIGEPGGRTLYRVIQHATLETRLKYVPIMKEAVKKGNCRARYLASVEDRIATDQGRPQIYGNQVKYYPASKSMDVWPIVDPENINSRRASIGLSPIAEHLKDRFDLEWDIEKQKERTASFLASMEDKK